MPILEAKIQEEKLLYANKSANIHNHCMVEDRFTTLEKGREQFTSVLAGGGPAIIVEGAALSSTWHSPLPDSALIDFKPLITALRASPTYRRYTAENGREYLSWD